MKKNTGYSALLLWRSSLRFLFRHPWQFGLSILGVALGVAVVVSVDLANESAMRAFELSTEAVTGSSTHYIRGSRDEIDQNIYRTIRTDIGMRRSAPVIEGYLQIQGTGRTVQLLGVDPIAEEGFRSFATTEAGIELSDFMTGRNSALLSEQMANDLRVSVDDWLIVSISGRSDSLRVSGIIDAGDERSRLALDNLIVTDISTAQDLFDMPGKLSRIDLILNDNDSDLTGAIVNILPAGTSLVRSEQRNEMVAQMTRAFDINLQALGMLALLVGMFLIYNTVTFSVVQRRPVIARLRAIGVLKREIFLLILAEAFLIGLAGTLFGILAGVALANILVVFITQTINDLYFVVSVRELTLNPATFFKASALGISGTILAASWPARNAALSPLTMVLRRSSAETELIKRMPKLRWFALVFLASGTGILLLQSTHIITGYLSLLLLIIGFSLLVPQFIANAVKWAGYPVKKILGIIGLMSVRGTAAELSRTSVAIAALVVAVAATVGVGMMIDSFRYTVESWLGSQLQADVYIQAPGGLSQQVNANLEPALISLMKSRPEVESSHSIRRTEVVTNFGFDNLVVPGREDGIPRSTELKRQTGDFWNRFDQETTVKVTEAYAYRNHVDIGDIIEITTDRGPVDFTIGAIYYDYSADSGLISMHRSVYEQYFDDHSISGLALYVYPDVDLESFIVSLREKSAGIQQVVIQSNRGLRETSMEIFDRTFTVTIVLRFLAIIVAFIGILSALMALQLERRREMAVLRANGLTPGQLWKYITTQTGFLGLIAGVLSIPLGIVMAGILVYVINLRSFGWTLQFQVTPDVLFQAVFLAFFAALLTGIYPSWKMSQTNPSDALRYE
jgi:putative ABC transport system permease protein